MGFFKILLGPIGLGLPFRPTTKRERFQRDSIDAQLATNELLGRLIESVESGSAGLNGTTETPKRPFSVQENMRRNREILERIAKHARTQVSETFIAGETVTTEVMCVIGWRALFQTKNGIFFSIRDEGLFARVRLDTGMKHDGDKLEIDVSDFGDEKDLYRFLRPGNIAEFLVTQAETYEPMQSLKSLTDKVQDPNNRRHDIQRIENQRIKYQLKLVKVAESGTEDSLTYRVGDIIVGILGSEGTGARTITLHDGRKISVNPRDFPSHYRVREGISHFWLVNPGDEVWLKVEPPANKHLPTNQYSFEVIPPPSQITSK